ncbi:tyrosine-protein phosphatase [Sphingomonas melonis]|uniref:Protein-tyrosine phosphatase n=1 Tax=Sphingomonas melonis TaxID=152682 RepID=A0A7Y9FLL4_9SPHN|nr:tyrosine-protein phosphatase [Sphingomonas melonis]NYD88366.1 protein-tyrosine phosphatase [Sphingomonas melonis]
MRAVRAASLALLAVAPGAAVVAQSPRSAIAAAAAAAHERLLPLQGGRNFRDLGGYATEDGRHVRWGMLYRSGSMHDLTPADYAALQRRGIRVVCDLRDTRERSAEPVHWPATGAPQMLSDDYALDTRDFLPATPMKDWTAEAARAAMTASYPKMLVQFRGQYRRMFAELLAGHAPLAFNCSAGKDRTGVAAALLLTALGVPRQTVIDDYLLTNRYLDPAKLFASPAQADSPWAHLPPGVMAALAAADRRYIEAALAVLDRHPDGATGWLRDEMGLSAADITRLRALYLS